MRSPTSVPEGGSVRVAERGRDLAERQAGVGQKQRTTLYMYNPGTHHSYMHYPNMHNPDTHANPCLSRL